LPEACTKTASRAIFAAATSLLFTILLGPVFIKWLQVMKVGQPIRDDVGFLLAELHKQKKNTPTMGGALIMASVFVSVFIWADWATIFPWLLMSSLFVFGLIGVFDDWAKLKSKSSRGLPGRFRLLVQSLYALLVIFLLSSPHFVDALRFKIPLLQYASSSVAWDYWLSCVYVPFHFQPVFVACGISWVFIWLIQWLTMVGSANAVNLTDGLDGLAAGCSVWATVPLAVFAFMSNHQELAGLHSMAYIQGSGEVSVCLAALCGACLGFLWFNSYPAQVFMGDTGSLAIGGMLGTAAVLLHREWLFALVGGIFVIETLSVMVQVFSFKRSGKRIFRCTPLHHHFEYGGIHESKVVVRFWIVGVLLAILGLISILV
jgi:phospho-N-acetylmuramoyl-pentapeptide-transferase